MQHDLLMINGICHVYNRGVDKRIIFPESNYYLRFINTIKHNLKFDWPLSRYIHRIKRAQDEDERSHVKQLLEQYRSPPSVEIISFCLMPNHYHFTIKQLTENGISSFMQRLGTAFTKYFNIRNDRSGRLFESSFKVVPVESEKQLVHLVRYQHINPRSIRLETPAELLEYKWSSLSTYAGKEKNLYPFVSVDLPLSSFNSRETFLRFTFEEVSGEAVSGIQEVAIDDDFGWFVSVKQYEKERKQEKRERFLNSSFAEC